MLGEIEDDLNIDDVEVAETLLRCVQEAITNTLKHAGAKRIWIRIRQGREHVHLQVTDDGTVDGDLVEGHGLTGMRERLEALRGSLELADAGDALSLSVEIPLSR